MSDEFFKPEDFVNCPAEIETLSAVAKWANRILRERGVVVYVYQRDNGSMFAETEKTDYKVWHSTALLINIKPIKKDTAEDVLRDLVIAYENQPRNFTLDDVAERARALLGQK